MSWSLNKILLAGYVGKKPEMLGDGKTLAFSLATSERWKDKETSEKREKTEWHDVIIYNHRIAEYIEKYVDKGSKVFVEGKLQYIVKTDQNGSKIKKASIIVDLSGNVSIVESSDSSNETASIAHKEDDLPF
jgi:single-strand DNA-binding protein